jgi:hypothetical protein
LRHGRAAEDLLGIGKIETVLSQVGGALAFVPGEIHAAQDPSLRLPGPGTLRRVSDVEMGVSVAVLRICAPRWKRPPHPV